MKAVMAELGWKWGDNELIVGAIEVSRRVESLRERVWEFLYRLMLFQRPCLHCGAMRLVMLRDGECRCDECGAIFDPTIAFQRCGNCGEGLTLKRCHYWCTQCGEVVTSLFKFDERVYDREYFRERMRESRERKTAVRTRLRELAKSLRSQAYVIEEPPQESVLPELAADIDAFVDMGIPESLARIALRAPFNMDAYRHHIRELVTGCIVHFEGISPLIDNQRLDRVYRFITVIFMEHEREIITSQNGNGEILLMER